LSHPKGSINRAVALNRLAALPFLLLIGGLSGTGPVIVALATLGVCAGVLIADMAVWNRSGAGG
jgi:hypothetical protein